MAGFIDLLRSGAWLTRERMRLVAFALLAAFVLGAGFLIATSNGLNDRFGRPLGTDFSNVYAAGTYVLDGEPARRSTRRANSPASGRSSAQATQFYGWHYPPFFLGLAAAPGGDALLARADRVAGRDAGSLSLGHARDRLCVTLPGSGRDREDVASPRPRLPGRVHQSRPGA